MKSHQLAVGAGEVEQETQIKWEVRALLGSIWTPAPSSGRQHRLRRGGAAGAPESSASSVSTGLVQGQQGGGPWARLALGPGGWGVGLTIGRFVAVSVSATRDNKVSNRTSPFRP